MASASSTTDTASSDSELESAVKFKIKRRLNCIICKKSGTLCHASQKSFTTFMKCVEIRQNITNILNPGIDEAIADGKAGNLQSVVWHKSCYLSFISKKNIESLGKKYRTQKQCYLHNQSGKFYEKNILTLTNVLSVVTQKTSFTSYVKKCRERYQKYFTN